jgi:hypothetical protein
VSAGRRTAEPGIPQNRLRLLWRRFDPAGPRPLPRSSGPRKIGSN